MFKEKIKLCNINDLKINSVNLFKHKDTKILLTYTKDGIYLSKHEANTKTDPYKTTKSSFCLPNLSLPFSVTR